MKKAIKIECDTMKNSIPVILTEEEQGWSDNIDTEKMENQAIANLWHSNVPGSHATEHVIIAAIQDMENMGYDVTEAEKYIDEGIKASENQDYAEMSRLSTKIYHLLNIAPKIDSHPHWCYTIYESFEQVAKKVNFPIYPYNKEDKSYLESTYNGWIAQIAGGALGTAIEGYTKENLEKAFGNIDFYVRTPNTYNDDITYELAFLEALDKAGDKITSADIAEQWVALVPCGWSAEDRALKNLKLGIYPPESGKCNNPYREWIGAQMRGVVCGMVAPGDVKKAAYYAFIDGQVSHHNNGVLGEVFNAVLCSLAYVKQDIREIVEEAVSLIPDDSEYYSVVKFALDECKKTTDWKHAWAKCEEKYGSYNWIHAYPNACAEVVALWFGLGDFNKTMNICAMSGFDVDCNAAQIGTVCCIASEKAIEEKWSAPFGDLLTTYMRKITKLSIKELSENTVRLGRK